MFLNNEMLISQMMTEHEKDFWHLKLAMNLIMIHLEFCNIVSSVFTIHSISSPQWLPGKAGADIISHNSVKEMGGGVSVVSVWL